MLKWQNNTFELLTNIFPLTSFRTLLPPHTLPLLPFNKQIALEEEYAKAEGFPRYVPQPPNYINTIM